MCTQQERSQESKQRRSRSINKSSQKPKASSQVRAEFSPVPEPCLNEGGIDGDRRVLRQSLTSVQAPTPPPLLVAGRRAPQLVLPDRLIFSSRHAEVGAGETGEKLPGRRLPMTLFVFRRSLSFSHEPATCYKLLERVFTWGRASYSTLFPVLIHPLAATPRA